MATRQQAIIWTNDDLGYWRIYVSLNLNDLTDEIKNESNHNTWLTGMPKWITHLTFSWQRLYVLPRTSIMENVIRNKDIYMKFSINWIINGFWSYMFHAAKWDIYRQFWGEKYTPYENRQAHWQNIQMYINGKCKLVWVYRIRYVLKGACVF